VQNGITAVHFLKSKNKRHRFFDIKGIRQDPGERLCSDGVSFPKAKRCRCEEWTAATRRFKHLDVVGSVLDKRGTV
jgi:hypothetical protein